MNRYILLLLISVSAIAGTRDNFNRANGALGDKWINAPGQTSGTGITIVSNSIIPSNVLGVNHLAFSVFDSLITNVDSLRIGFTLNHLSTDAPAGYNDIFAQFSFLSTKSVASGGGARGWKLAFHSGHITIVFARDSVDEYQSLDNVASPTLVAGDTLYLEIRYGGDSCYVFRNSETTPLCRAGDVAWNIIQLGSGGYVHVGALVQNDQSVFDNFIIGKASVAVVTPPSTLNTPPVIQAYDHVPTIADTSSLVYITTRVTDDYKIDSITVYVEGTPNSGTYTAKKALKTLSFGTKDTTISTVATAAKYSVGAHRYFVRAKDDSGAVTISPTKSFTVGIASSLWRTAYYATWSYGNNASNFSCPPWDIDMSGLTHIVLFDNGNVTQTSPYWAYMFGPPGDTVMTPRPADCESDSVSVEFNGVSDPRDGHWPKYLDSLITIAHRNNVKVVITIQAVAKTTPNLNYVAADSARTQLFVNTCVAWAERKKFDGVEIDWEGWSGTALPDSTIVDRFVRILYRRVRTMQTVSGQPGEIQISAGSSYQNYYSPSQDYMVNQFNLQLYDYSYAWYDQPIMSNAAWHISPLYRGSGLPANFQGMSWDTRGPLQWIAAGHDRKRLGVGFPTFGWILRNVDTLLAPMTSGGDYGQANYQVIEALKANGGVEVWDDIRKVRYIKGTALNTVGTIGWGRDGVTAGQKFLATSENAQSLAEKVAWVKANGLGGFMIYDHISDYDKAQPKGSALRRPLQYALQTALGAVTTPVYPSVPALSSPNNAATGFPITGVTFVWKSSANSTKYDIEISPNSSFSSIAYSGSNITDTTVTAVISPNLGYSTPYYWHVRGVNANGSSSWSPAYSFVTLSQFTSAPVAPVLSAPANGATGQDVTVNLSWTAGDAITTSYQYQYGADTVSGTKQIINAATGSATLTGLGYSSVYNWHVRAVNSYGASPWTVWRNFSTISAPPVVINTLDIFPVTFNVAIGKVQNSAPPYWTVKQNDSSNVPTPSTGYANVASSGVRLSDGSFKAFSSSSGSAMTPDQIITQVNLGTQSINGSRIQALGTSNAGVAPSPANAKNVYLRTNTSTGALEWGGLPSAGSGDVASNTASSVDGEIVLFSGTAGKTVKRATTSGIPKLSSGVLAAATAGVDYARPQDVGDTVRAHGVAISATANNIPMINATGDSLINGPVTFGAVVDSNAAHLAWNKLDRDSINSHNTRINALKQLALDSIAARLAWSKVDRDSINSHNTRINAVKQLAADSIGAHNTRINAAKQLAADSIAAHNTRINSKQATITNLGDTSGYAHNYDSLKLHYVLLAGKVAKADIYTIGQPMALDSSMITAGRVFPMMIGNNEIVDSVFIIAAGSACSFTTNFYCSQTNFTAVDSLLSAVWSATTANGKQSKVLTDMRNSGSLATRIWWMKITTVTSKPDAVVVQMKGHRP